jgi:hypothetical protein
VPDDPVLGLYRKLFSNTLCFLEEREPGSAPGETKTTPKVISKLLEDNDHHVNQQSVLNARLLDMLAGDWDRHFDQWRFGTSDTGKGKLYFAMPRDRDQVFFNSDGLLLKLVSNNAMPFLRGFKKDLKRLEWLNWEARDFDRLFLNSLDEEDWKRSLQAVKTKLTDQVIVDAVKRMPPDIYSIRGEEIIDKLKVRRDLLTEKNALKYYKFLSKEVNIIGSNKKEYFKISKAPKGLQVRVYKRSNEKDSAAVMFDRVFDEALTKRINLYGLDKADIFDIDEDVNTKIKMRIVGGSGDDTFNIKGKAANYIYDLRTQNNFVFNPGRSKLRMSSDPDVNAYDITSHTYNIFRFPRINIGFNPEDGLMVGLGYLSRTYGFRNEPYATQQRISSLYAPSSGAYQFAYNGEFNHFTGTTDFIFNANYVHPVLNNFFG